MCSALPLNGLISNQLLFKRKFLRNYSDFVENTERTKGHVSQPPFLDPLVNASVDFKVCGKDTTKCKKRSWGLTLVTSGGLELFSPLNSTVHSVVQELMTLVIFTSREELLYPDSELSMTSYCSTE